jgi:hypothetical protein
MAVRKCKLLQQHHVDIDGYQSSYLQHHHLLDLHSRCDVRISWLWFPASLSRFPQPGRLNVTGSQGGFSLAAIELRDRFIFIPVPEIATHCYFVPWRIRGIWPDRSVTVMRLR